jgi:hypothetical protein
VANDEVKPNAEKGPEKEAAEKNRVPVEKAETRTKNWGQLMTAAKPNSLVS